MRWIGLGFIVAVYAVIFPAAGFAQKAPDLRNPAGKFVTRDLVLRMAKAVGKRLTVQQAAKYVPLAGQAVSAIMGFTALRYLGEEHIKDCVRVAREAHLKLPSAPRKSLS